jgi:hypothetical protein
LIRIIFPGRNPPYPAYVQAKEKRAMNLTNGIGQQAIKDVIELHPQIGRILESYDIGCVGCGVGICLLKDVVTIHALGEKVEEQLEKELNEYCAHNPTDEGHIQHIGEHHE